MNKFILAVVVLFVLGSNALADSANKKEARPDEVIGGQYCYVNYKPSRPSPGASVIISDRTLLQSRNREWRLYDSSPGTKMIVINLVFDEKGKNKKLEVYYNDQKWYDDNVPFARRCMGIFFPQTRVLTSRPLNNSYSSLK